MEKRKGRKDWESWIDQQIREAQDRGEFDDLPGKGKPLDLTPNPYAQDREMAFKVLKNAGYAPDWIEQDKTIRGRLDQARATLTRQWQWRETRLAELAGRSDRWSAAEQDRVRQSWQKAVAAFEKEVTAINTEITDLNLKVPAARFQRPKIDAARELERLTEEIAKTDAKDTRTRKAQAVRLVVTSRERAPRSPRMERALKHLIWRYCRPDTKFDERTEHDDNPRDH